MTEARFMAHPDGTIEDRNPLRFPNPEGLGYETPSLFEEGPDCE